MGAQLNEDWTINDHSGPEELFQTLICEENNNSHLLSTSFAKYRDTSLISELEFDDVENDIDEPLKGVTEAPLPEDCIHNMSMISIDSPVSSKTSRVPQRSVNNIHIDLFRPVSEQPRGANASQLFLSNLSKSEEIQQEDSFRLCIEYTNSNKTCHEEAIEVDDFIKPKFSSVSPEKKQGPNHSNTLMTCTNDFTTPKKPKNSIPTLADFIREQFDSPSLRQTPTNDDDYFLNSLSSEFEGARHPDAEKYILKGIKNESTRNELTSKLFEIYQKQCFNDELPITIEDISWNGRLRKTAGLCRNNFSRKISKIELSTKVCTTPDRLRDTLIHELCHAAAWVIDGFFKAGHGPIWKKWVTRALSKCPSLPNIERCHTYKIEAKYTYYCNGCGQRVNRHSKSLDTNRKVCGRCHGKFQLKRKSGIRKRVSNKFSKYIKYNYSNNSNEELNHRETNSRIADEYTPLHSKEEESLDISILSIQE